MLSGLTLITRNRSPRGPPPTPGWPSPATRILEPLSTPAGILTCRRLLRGTTPWPAQVLHTLPATSPVPWQVGQTSVDWIVNVRIEPRYASLNVTSTGCSMLSPARLEKLVRARVLVLVLVPPMPLRPKTVSKKSEKPLP